MKLTILDAKTHEPVLILSQDDTGIKCIGGDPKKIQELGLDRFHTVQEIADYINSDGGLHLQAIFDDKSNTSTEENSSQEDRLGPALKVIKDLLGRVERRVNSDKITVGSFAAADQQKPKEQKLPEEGPIADQTVVENKPTMLYVSYDGDNIGNAVARAEEKDDERELAQMSQRIQNGQKAATEWALQNGGTIIEQGGDEGLVKVPSPAFNKIEDLRAAYYGAVGATLTVGVGQKISESTKARMLGKLKGKNQVCVFDGGTEQELELRTKDQDKSEANKIKTAMETGPDFQQAAQAAQPSQQQAPQESQAPSPEKDQSPDPKQAKNQDQEDAKEPDDKPRVAVHQDVPKWGMPQAPPGEMTDQEQEQSEGQDKESSKKEDVTPPPFSKDLLNSIGKRSKSPAKSIYRNPYSDPEIEGMDFSKSEDPEFAKALNYAARYGSGSNE